MFSESQLQKARAAGETGKVLAANVVVENTNNNLKSATLQEALDKEIAATAKTTLAGTSWTIHNITTNVDFMDSSGNITFNSTGDIASLTQGVMQAGILRHKDAASFGTEVNSDISLNFVTDKIIKVSFINVANVSKSTFVTVESVSASKVILKGPGGSDISILTRVE